MQRRVVDLVHLDGHDFLQLANLLLHLHGFRGLVAEAVDELARLLNLALLVLVGPQLLFAALFSEYDILVVFHPVVDDLSAGDFQRAIGDIIDESAVVAHEHHSRRTLCQKLLQPLDRLNVEMVRRLVEQQHVGTAQQNLRQLDAHAPTAGELAGGAVEVGAEEAQSQQRALHLGLIAFAAEHQVALVLLREPLHESHVVVALVVGALGEFAFHALHALLQPRCVAERLAGLFLHGGIVGQPHHLRQIAYRGVVRNIDRAARGLLLATQNLQQRRLARAVLAHEGDAVAIVDDETCLAEQRLHAKLHL